MSTPKSASFFTRKNILAFSFFIAFLVVVSVLVTVFFLDIKTGDVKTIINTINRTNWPWILLIVLGIVVTLAWNIIINWWVARRFCFHAPWWEWVLFACVVQFFQIVTPLSLGQDPFRLYWFIKKGMKKQTAVLLVTSTGAFWNLAQALITWPSFFVLSQNYALLEQNHEGFVSYWFSFAGMIFDVVVAILFIFIAYSKRMHVLIYSGVNQFRKWIKRPYLTKEQIYQRFIDKAEFNKLYGLEIKRLGLTIFKLLANILIAVVGYFSVFAVFAIVKKENATNNVIDQYSTADIFNITNIAITASNFIPVPSGEGATQFVMTSFLNAFKSAVGIESQVKQGVFLWRFLSVYIPAILFSLCFIGWVVQVVIEFKHPKPVLPTVNLINHHFWNNKKLHN
ncbi:lysylphosphatidylglycerol synthase transmembrane domain-containing protein [Mycoplasmoides pneumoniae]|uniref:Uncharacterized protein MG306 homolog n=1 Tax=Mycoplasma pneumoniae (strain ATCC 29342 / M129 / Subtype 1) TaxID=272634 RepID=Y435_MYCPN|nr:YbhN family protein [Mycoplasmoides pneumoniae]P75343.1 RecName: Full=Uncharacterized protein MG306 homolog [Mycoplasmoides pneumoniae M129]AAB96054.1 permease [Mycoplasmoides pneumoniae M129]AGC04341.1 hypothetical protein C985_0442 [Mycoplasmoides pneumoniae M129-B7]ALA30313.1 hypothetical protein C897_02475 [Mycoplasmoides pneumoniae PI 1428]ALA32420.1 hypothetical protein F533_02475 [Mycoplasmoides pneumoniae 51494]ALA33119.1 hypothetical protein F530_02475 [Mycoplasmoides pneumoniae 5